MEQLTIGVHVPAEGIARVIGKGGAGLRQIRETCGCKLQVNEGADWSKKRRVSLTGPVQGLGNALQQTLLKAFQDDLTNIAVTVMIPAEFAGQVVGKAGNNLQRVRDSYGVRLDLERDPIHDPAFGAERTLTMSGSAMAMGQALCMALTGVGGAVLPSQIPPSLQLGAGMHNNLGTVVVSGVDVRQVSHDPEELQLHMAVPVSLVGAILGREGQTIKQTGTKSGCKISVTKKDSTVGERRVVIIGKFSQCQLAQVLLQQQLEAAASSAGDVDVSTARITYWVRSGAAGAVIGKGGNTLRQVREQTGTKIQFDREEIHGQRPCTISGAGAQVMEAISKIFEIVSQEPLDADLAEPPGGKRMANPVGVAASGNGLKRQRVEGESASTKLLVPARFAGAVIGKQGSGLARIRESCGVKVEVLQPGQAPHWTEDRVVILQGPFACRQSAVKAVLEAAFQGDIANSMLKMLVLRSEAGAVIGKAGATLKMIREQSGVSVHVEKNDILGERLVSASGTLNSILSVAQWVMWSISSDDRQEGRADVEPTQAPTTFDAVPPAPAFAVKGAYSWPGL